MDDIDYNLRHGIATVGELLALLIEVPPTHKLRVQWNTLVIIDTTKPPGERIIYLRDLQQEIARRDKELSTGDRTLPEPGDAATQEKPASSCPGSHRKR